MAIKLLFITALIVICTPRIEAQLPPISIPDEIPVNLNDTLDNVCSLPLADGVACTTVCGTEGGTCYAGICYCYCRAITQTVVDRYLYDTNTFFPSCTASSNQTANRICNETFCKPYGYNGKMCSVTGTQLGIPGAPNTDICTCDCPKDIVLPTNNALLYGCTLPGFKSVICQQACGPLGGICTDGVCDCRCPITVDGKPITDPALFTDFVGCPVGQRVPRTEVPDQYAACVKICSGDNPNVNPGYRQEICSLLPLNPPIISNLPLIYSLYKRILRQTYVCSCWDINGCAEYAEA